MKKEKILFIIFIALLNYWTINSQIDECLKPINGFFDSYGISYESNTIIRKILFDGLGDNPQVRYLVLNSKNPEILIDLTHNEVNNSWNLIFRTPNHRILSLKPDYLHKIKVIEVKKEIDKEYASLINELFLLAVNDLKYSKKGMTIKHGTNYYFTVRKHGMRSGTIYSPIPSSRTGKLVEIGNDLIKYAKNEVMFDSIIIDKIKHLISKYK